MTPKQKKILQHLSNGDHVLVGKDGINVEDKNRELGMSVSRQTFNSLALKELIEFKKRTREGEVWVISESGRKALGPGNKQ